jgi:hypothetical protein
MDIDGYIYRWMYIYIDDRQIRIIMGNSDDESMTIETARGAGVCSRSRFPSIGSGGVPENSPVHQLLVQASNDKDIVKKGSLRKGRVLCVFADRVRPVKGGKLGTIRQLDGDPYMDVAFPEGVMRFRGSLVFPSNKYLSLKVGNKDVVCEDVFDSILLFGEVEWLPLGEAARRKAIRRGTDDDVFFPASLLGRVVHGGVQKRKTAAAADENGIETKETKIETKEMKETKIEKKIVVETSPE